jgi:hypothetical protein
MVLRLKFVHSAHINMDIAVSLSPSGSLYDLQKRRYDFWEFRERAWPVDRENAKISLGTQANFVLNIKMPILANFQHSEYNCNKIGRRHRKW